MKRYQLLFLLIFLLNVFCNDVSAQSSHKLDSLLSILKNMPEDTNKVNTYSNVFLMYRKNRKENQISRKYIDSIHILSKRLNYDNGIAESHFYYANLDQFEGDFSSAINHLNYYLNYNQKKDNLINVAEALFSLGKAYKKLAVLDESLIYLYRSAEVYEKINHKNGQALAYNSIGSVNNKLKKYDESIKYYNKANILFKELVNTKMYAMGLQNLGNVYKGKKKYNVALNYFNQALELIEKLDLKYEKAIIYGNLAGVYTVLDQNEKALNYYLKSYQIKKTLPNKRTQAFALAGIGNSLIKLQRYSEADGKLDDALALSFEIGSKDLLAEIYGLKSLLGKKKNDYKTAYKNLENSHKWKDSIFNQKNSQQINELQTKYNTAQKEKEIALLTKEKEIQKKEADRKSTLNKAIIGGLTFTLLLAGLLFYTFRQRVRNQKIVSKKNEQIKEVNYKQQLSKLEMKALRAQMNPHFVFNCLNSINRMILGGEIKNASSYLTKFSRLIRKVLENSEKNMVSVADELTMLKAYIQLESLRFKGKITYKTDIDKSMNLDATFIPSMVLQPLIENAIWHGLMHKEKGGTILLSIIKQNNVLKCSVEDNGVGRKKSTVLSDTSVVKQKSMGLKLTSERLKIMSKLGLKRFINIIDLKDENDKAIGTRVDVLIPIT